MSKPELIVDGKNRLGESAMWHPREQKLYWVDVRAPAIYRLEADNRVTTFPLPSLAGGMVPRKSGGIAIALQNGFHAVDTATGALTFIADPEPDKPDNRVNDGSCDRAGPLLGRHAARHHPRAARLALPARSRPQRAEDVRGHHRDQHGALQPGRPHALLRRHLQRPDVRVRLFAGRRHDRQPPRVRRHVEDHPGHPDGSAIDADGCLWNAEYGGSRVVRYTPQGKIDRTIEFPVTQPTSCCFGGPNLDTLYVTSATQRIEPELLAKQPLAGGLFAVHAGVKGLPEPEYWG